MANGYTLDDLLGANAAPGPADPDDVMVAALLSSDGRYHTLHGVVGQLTTKRAESSYGQPVLVIGGQAYGPGHVTPYGPAHRLVLLPRTNRNLCDRWSKLCQSLCGESATAKAMEEARAEVVRMQNMAEQCLAAIREYYRTLPNGQEANEWDDVILRPGAEWELDEEATNAADPSYSNDIAVFRDGSELRWNPRQGWAAYAAPGR